MLTIKPTTSSSAEPDPAGHKYDTTQIIFVQDEPEIPEPTPPQMAQLAERIQGGQVSSMDQGSATPQQDMPEAALSDNYKKGMRNQTEIADQEEHGQVDIIKDAIIAHEEQRKQKVLPPAQAQQTHAKTAEKESVSAAPNDLKVSDQLEQQRIKSAEILQTIFSDLATPAITKSIADLRANNEQNNTSNKPSLLNEPIQTQTQKVVSKKHRPAEIGTENLSKVQLSKPTQPTIAQKNKLSLQDIQNGFAQFIKNSPTRQLATPTSSTFGNSLYFSSTGNAQKDDEMGLKYASYMNQTGKIYNVAFSEYSDFIKNSMIKEGLPSSNSYVQITIERSGKVQAHIAQSCGNPTIDHYHLKVIEAMGLLPPIPKYLEAPITVTAQLRFR